MIRPNQGDPFDEAPIIYRYTRRQAIEDGVLVDLSPWARETAFRIPVACTAAVWHQYIVPPEGTKELGQSERGRVHDLLSLLFLAILQLTEGHDNTITFSVIFLDAGKQHQTVQLKAICGPGDEGEPVLTVMLPTED